MALQEYITLSDVTNGVFERFNAQTKQKYIDRANDKIEDLAIVNDVAVEDIAMPIHSVLREYAVNYAVNLLVQDKSFVDNKNVSKDKYELIFKQTEYKLKELKEEIVPVVFTKLNQTDATRDINWSVGSAVVKRG